MRASRATQDIGTELNQDDVGWVYSNSSSASSTYAFERGGGHLAGVGPRGMPECELVQPALPTGSDHKSHNPYISQP